MKSIRLFSSFLLLGLSVADVQANDLNCQHANSSVEISICNTPELKALDEELYQVYDALRASQPEAQAITYSQRRWVKAVRNRCKTEACIASAYRTRINVYQSWKTPETNLSSVTGAYGMVRLNMVFGGDAYGWKTLETQDCLSIQNKDGGEYRVDLTVTPKQSEQQCILSGTFAVRGQYLERVPSASDPAPACVLQIHPRKYTLALIDPNNACQQACGANLPLNQTEFLRDQTGINACHAPKVGGQSTQ
jgi:uncharacterized protein